LQAPTVFTIAQDLKKMLVYTKTDESDVGTSNWEGVTFKVMPSQRTRFGGVVSQVRMNPTTVQNVVTYDTNHRIRQSGVETVPGMTAYVSIPRDDRAKCVETA